MITITEEPYDGPVADGLVQELLVELNERYADDVLTGQADAPDDDDYLAEVTPELVTASEGDVPRRLARRRARSAAAR